MASLPCFEWHPAKYLQSKDAAGDFALLVLNQPLRNGVNLRKLWINSSVRVAADGGANRLYELSTFQGKFSNLQAIIGDMDSVSPTVRDFYSSQPQPALIVHDADQSSTDFSKSVRWIRATYRPDADIVALGGLGGRVDQGLSQLHHLYLFQPGPAYPSGRLFLLSGSSLTFLLKPGRHRIHVRGDDDADDVAAAAVSRHQGRGRAEDGPFARHVGIVPLREPSRLTTRGLEWDVDDWTSRFGEKISTSNRLLPETRVLEVETTSDVLFTIALRQVDGDDDS